MIDGLRLSAARCRARRDVVADGNRIAVVISEMHSDTLQELPSIAAEAGGRIDVWIHPFYERLRMSIERIDAVNCVFVAVSHHGSGECFERSDFVVPVYGRYRDIIFLPRENTAKFISESER